MNTEILNFDEMAKVEGGEILAGCAVMGLVTIGTGVGVFFGGIGFFLGALAASAGMGCFEAE